MSASPVEAADLISAAEESAHESASPAGERTSLELTADEAVEWARAVDLSTVTGFTNLQLADLAHIAEQQMSRLARHVKTNNYLCWMANTARATTVKKLNKKGLTEPIAAAAERYGDSSSEWTRDSWVINHVAYFALTPLGEQIATALYLDQNGSERLRAQWGQMLAGIAETRELRRERERERDRRVRQEAQMIALIRERDPRIAEMIRGEIDRRYNSTKAAMTATPRVSLTMGELATIMGVELTE